MTETALLTALKKLPLFSGLESEQLEEIAQIAVTSSFERNQLIFLEGTTALGFYVVLSGQVKIYKTAPDGREQILHIFGPGEPFAEAAMFAGKNYPANAMATQPSRALFIRKDSLLGLLRDDPALALNMLAAMSKRLKQFASQVEQLTLRETPARLAAYFLHESDLRGGAQTLELDVSKGHLANLLGTARETLSRCLGKLAEAGYIESEGGKVTIINREALWDLASGEVKMK